MSRYDYRFHLSIPLRPGTTGPQILEAVRPVVFSQESYATPFPDKLRTVLMTLMNRERCRIDEGNGFLEWKPETGELEIETWGAVDTLGEFTAIMRPFVEALGPLAADSGCAVIEDLNPDDVDAAFMPIPYGVTRTERVIGLLDYFGHHSTIHLGTPGVGDPRKDTVLERLETELNQRAAEAMAAFRQEAEAMIRAANLDGPSETENEGLRPS